MPRFVGIDLGVNGAVAIWDGSDEAPTLHPLPLDEERELDAMALYKLLRSDSEVHVVYEQCFRPNSLLRLQGAARAACQLAGVDVINAVAVVTWKIAVLGRNSSDKQSSIDWAKKKWPTINLRRSKRSRTDWHDAAEAAALAFYSKVLNGNGIR